MSGLLLLSNSQSVWSSDSLPHARVNTKKPLPTFYFRCDGATTSPYTEPEVLCSMI
jgi:hypothetical protein